MVGCKGRWVEEVSEWVWDWIPSRGRAMGDLDHLIELLENVRFSQNREDKWKWRIEPNRVFSVSSLARWIKEMRVSSLAG
ncbi:hypothetical protein Tco_0339060, partial [Tanacetum coccineum]